VKNERRPKSFAQMLENSSFFSKATEATDDMQSDEQTIGLPQPFVSSVDDEAEPLVESSVAHITDIAGDETISLDSDEETHSPPRVRRLQVVEEPAERPRVGVNTEEVVDTLPDSSPISTKIRKPKYQPPVKVRKNIELQQSLIESITAFADELEQELGVKTTDTFHIIAAIQLYEVIRKKLPYLIDDLYELLDGNESPQEAQSKILRALVDQTNKLHSHR
jgi:hypothetical protein